MSKKSAPKKTMPKKPAKPRAQFTDDNFYHQFFSNAEVVADLIKTVQPGLLAELDVNSFVQVSNEFISADMRARRSDVFWKVKWHSKEQVAEEGWLYIYILLEFKSRAERFCILQVLEYLVLAYRDLINKNALTASQKLPPLLPIVLYNGDIPWQQPKSLAELIEPGPVFFKPYIPDFNLLVIDENDYRDAPLEMTSLISAIFTFENSRHPLDLKSVTEAFFVWFNSHPKQQLKQTIINRVKHSLKNVLSPDILNQVSTLEELSPMFATRAEKFMEQQKQQWQYFGWQEGRQEGRQEGEIHGKRAFLMITLTKRFEAVSALAKQLVESADAQQLDDWLDVALKVNSLDEWLSRATQ